MLRVFGGIVYYMSKDGFDNVLPVLGSSRPVPRGRMFEVPALAGLSLDEPSAERPSLVPPSQPKTINLVISSHGGRVPFKDTLKSNAHSERVPQWFRLNTYKTVRPGFDDVTDLYFTNNVFSDRAGGCTTLATSIYKKGKICKYFGDYITPASEAVRDAMKYEWDVYEGKRSGPLLRIKDRLAFSTSSPASNPKFDSRDCVPNMALEGDWAGKYPPGIYVCTEEGLQLIRKIGKSYLHKEVEWCERNAPWFGDAEHRPYRLNIFILTCTRSLDVDTHGNTTPFLRPAKSTRNYSPAVLNQYERKCDAWAELRLATAKYFKDQKPKKKGGTRRKRRRKTRKGSKPASK